MAPITEWVVKNLEDLPRLAHQPPDAQFQHAASRGRSRHREGYRVVFRREHQHAKCYLNEGQAATRLCAVFMSGTTDAIEWRQFGAVFLAHFSRATVTSI